MSPGTGPNPPPPVPPLCPRGLPPFSDAGRASTQEERANEKPSSGRRSPRCVAALVIRPNGRSWHSLERFPRWRPCARHRGLSLVPGRLRPFTCSSVPVWSSAACLASRHLAGSGSIWSCSWATLIWSLRGIAGGASLAHSLFGPVVLLAILAVLMPVLAHWRPRRAARTFAIVTTVTIALGLASAAPRPALRTKRHATHSVDAQAKGVLQ